jgi:hypothetical protein
MLTFLDAAAGAGLTLVVHVPFVERKASND